MCLTIRGENSVVTPAGLPDSQAHQCHAQCNPSEESHSNEGFQAHGGICFFFHVVISTLDHASSPKSESMRLRIGDSFHSKDYASSGIK
jgi:hypothetical protein